jgi:hypothetical protein
MLRKCILPILCLYAVLSITARVWGQQIILDEPVKAGQLTLFPDMNNPNAYYYLSDKPRLATDEKGRPKFSFLRYVQNTTSGKEGEGGGIVHAVVMLDVTPEQLREADQALQRIRSGAKIMGPIVYSGGTIALISSIAQPNGEFAKTVIGLGKAPILDGQKAAISIHLNKLGAKILHESFKTPTPDLSISFDMSVKGFRKPKKAIIEANFDQMYEHKAFNAGMRGNLGPVVLAAEIKTAFDDLVRSGAIKVINKGADEQMEKLIEDAYSKLTKMMFEPANGTGVPGMSEMAASAGGGQGLMDRATTMLNSARTEAQAENQRIREENRRDAAAQATAARQQPVDTVPPAQRSETPPPRTAAPAAATSTTTPGSPTSYYSTPPRRSPSPHARTIDPANPAAAAVAGRRPEPREEVSVPRIAIAMSFEMRRTRQQGTYRIDLEKWSADNLSMRFDENFGSIKCPECFVDVNLDDPLYRQRELTATLDGMDAPDFGQYINFATITMRKTHANGEVTLDEVKVDRQNFNQEGNNFKLIYGWKNDNVRAKWEDYEYKTVWNFFGGGMVESEWKKSNIQSIPLSAPYVRREILVDADPGMIADANVRAIEVKVFYKVGQQEMIKQIRLNCRNEQYSAQLDIITPRSEMGYDYEITWYLGSGSSITSGRKTSASSMLFVDQIPNH